jgi:O-antigen ligase
MTLWPVGVAMLSLTVVVGALLLPGRSFSTRATPAGLFRIGTGIAFAFSVDPTLGILATLGGWWWWTQEWRMAAGGSFWPLIAMAVSLGMHADPSWWHAALVTLLVIGIFQVGVGVCQKLKLPVLLHPEMIHGSLGHRTGYGIFLALLAPLAFLTDYGLVLAGLFAVGVILSRSAVAAGAYLAGMVLTVPALWGWAVGLSVAVVLYRSLKMTLQPGMPAEWTRIGRLSIKWRHLQESWTESRLKIWKATLQESFAWPFLMIGHGPQSFEPRSQAWFQRWNFRERYREAHNDYLEFFFEHGVIGILAVAWWFWRFAPELSLADPLTGSLAAAGTAMLANFPMRVATLGTVTLLVMILVMRRATWAF